MKFINFLPNIIEILAAMIKATKLLRVMYLKTDKYDACLLKG